MKRFLCFATLVAFALPALAQDREGNDTPGEWVITHHMQLDLWDSMCDERVTGAVKEERCYIRYVDVFSGRPNFAAQFAFITPEPDGHKVEFGVELGTQFTKGGFQVRDSAGMALWDHPATVCVLNSCTFTGERAAALLAAMLDGHAFHFAFNDRHGVDQVLRWELRQFEEILSDFTTQSTARGLPKG